MHTDIGSEFQTQLYRDYPGVTPQDFETLPAEEGMVFGITNDLGDIDVGETFPLLTVPHHVSTEFWSRHGASESSARDTRLIQYHMREITRLEERRVEWHGRHFVRTDRREVCLHCQGLHPASTCIHGTDFTIAVEDLDVIELQQLLTAREVRQGAASELNELREAYETRRAVIQREYPDEAKEDISSSDAEEEAPESDMQADEEVFMGYTDWLDANRGYRLNFAAPSRLRPNEPYETKEEMETEEQELTPELRELDALPSGVEARLRNAVFRRNRAHPRARDRNGMIQDILGLTREYDYPEEID
jgi:hypothetical protein